MMKGYQPNGETRMEPPVTTAEEAYKHHYYRGVYKGARKTLQEVIKVIDAQIVADYHEQMLLDRIRAEVMGIWNG